MKILKFNAFKILLLSAFVLFSCQTEDEEIIDTETQERLIVNSFLVDLMTRTCLNDGSEDNILDKASCFSVQLPLITFVAGKEIEVNTPSDFEIVEDILNTTTENLEFEYPIIIVLENYTKVIINNAAQLAAQKENCNGENQDDNDIECIDFKYELSYTVFNPITDALKTITISSDEDHYAFLSQMNANDIVNINFPLTLILADGSTLLVNSLENLEVIIEAAINICDEDDDIDFDDDDCQDCDVTLVFDTFNSCDYFAINKLQRSGQNLEDNYENFRFQFLEDGAIRVTDGTVYYEGSWTAAGEGQQMTVTIGVPDFSIFNDSWNLIEIATSDNEVRVDLKKGEDRLRFECDSDYVAPQQQNIIGTFIQECQERFDIVIDGDEEDFNSYGVTLEFEDEGAIRLYVASGFFSYEGTWELTQVEGADAMIIDFPNISTGSNNTWVFNQRNGDVLDLVSADGNSTLSMECIDVQERFNFLTTGSDWELSGYLINGFDVTETIPEYFFNFQPNYVADAFSSSAPDQVGTWGGDLLSTVELYFPDAPLDRFNGEWFVFIFEENFLYIVRREGAEEDQVGLVFERMARTTNRVKKDASAPVCKPR